MKTTLITGAANGLGAELSRTLAANDQQLILLDSDLNALNSLYDELDTQTPERIFLYPMDLKGATPKDYAELAETLINQFQTLDALYLNAAILPAFTPIEHFEEMQWYEVMQVNLNANFHLIHHLLPLLKQGGELIAISDQTIHQHPAYYGAYGVAKAGLEQLVKTISTENPTLHCHIAQLSPFQSSLRAQLFPGEMIEHLPIAAEVAKQLIQTITSSPETLSFTL